MYVVFQLIGAFVSTLPLSSVRQPRGAAHRPSVRQLLPRRQTCHLTQRVRASACELRSGTNRRTGIGLILFWATLYSVVRYMLF